LFKSFHSFFNYLTLTAFFWAFRGKIRFQNALNSEVLDECRYFVDEQERFAVEPVFSNFNEKIEFRALKYYPKFY